MNSAGPSPSPPAAIPATSRPIAFHLTGLATDDDSAPVVGAMVTILVGGSGPPPALSLSTSTDSQGRYNLDFSATGATGFVFAATSPGHEQFSDGVDARFDGDPIVENPRLYRIKRITAGESTIVTVAAGYSVCDGVAGTPDALPCRIVRVEVPTDGVLTMTCANQAMTILEFGLSVSGTVVGGVNVKAGTERIVGIGLPSAVGSQSCLFITSLAQ